VEWDRILASLDGREVLMQGLEFTPERFQDPHEGALHEAVRTAAPEIAASESSHRFSEVLEQLSRLADPIDAYFDHVLVNCEDPAVRSNRHAFLGSVYALFSRYADFSEIVETGAGAPPPRGPVHTRG
jgi:glycyl-tRNA synthetase beta subunit